MLSAFSTICSLRSVLFSGNSIWELMLVMRVYCIIMLIIICSAYIFIDHNTIQLGRNIKAISDPKYTLFQLFRATVLWWCCPWCWIQAIWNIPLPFLVTLLRFHLLFVELCLMNVRRDLKWTLLYYLCIFDLESCILYFFFFVVLYSHQISFFQSVFTCYCWQSRWKVGLTDPETEMSFISPLFITVENQ